MSFLSSRQRIIIFNSGRGSEARGPFRQTSQPIVCQPLHLPGFSLSTPREKASLKPYELPHLVLRGIMLWGETELYVRGFSSSQTHNLCKTWLLPQIQPNKEICSLILPLKSPVALVLLVIMQCLTVPIKNSAQNRS